MALSLRVLQSEQLPCEGCGGKCCVLAPFTGSELRAARVANGGSHPAGARVVAGLPYRGGITSIVVGPDGETCAYLREGRCSIYEARPLACQQYGRIPQMPCQVLHPREAARAAARLLRERLCPQES